MAETDRPERPEPAASNAGTVVGRGRGRGRGRGGGGDRGRAANANRHRGSRREGRGGHHPAATQPVVSDSATPEASSQPRTTFPTNTPSRRRAGRSLGRGGANARPAVSTVHGPQRAFGGHLSSQAPDAGPSSSAGLDASAPDFVPGRPSGGHRARGRQPRPRRPPPKNAPKSTASDLPTRIHEDIDNRQYECIICTEDVTRTTHVWTCDLCWAVLHRTCVRPWHNQEIANSKSRRDSSDHEPSWKCPACNSHLQEGIGHYHCWCGKDPRPNAVEGIPPHSCGQSCSKSRGTCPHPCALTCHAGPCPPCAAVLPNLSCYCGKEVQNKRCLDTSSAADGWSCGNTCDDFLSCGEHQCPRPCHTGLCGACVVTVSSRCYCGKSAKEMLCEERTEKEESFNHGQVPDTADADLAVPVGSWFTGSFECGEVCGRSYDCDEHKCEEPCHLQDEARHHCPLSPDVVSRCPCGKTPLSALMDTPRTTCTDEIPRCDKECGRTLPCGHPCPSPCHSGPCEPCLEIGDVTCRCGRTSSQQTCAEADSLPTPQCSRPCRGSLNCRRHFCEERCCPKDKQAKERLAARRQQRRRAGPLDDTEEVEEEHFCERICGKDLKCGNHVCPFPCHTGPCRSCMEAIWEDVTCTCGRTVLEPPQPCGTKPPNCRHPCLQPLFCGHPPIEHPCHTADTPCPKCTHLVEKPCVCGKKTLKNQRCWFDEGRCGLPCGKKLKCGAHFCQKTCHRGGECEDAEIQGPNCTQLCGETKKHCDHACRANCHAPLDCSEGKPCTSRVTRTCECRRLKREVKCGASDSNPLSAPLSLECDDECGRVKRVAQLRDAFSIGSDYTDDHIPYSDTTLDMFEENQSWCVEQELELRDFAADESKRSHRFKPMPPASRAFVHSLAKDFGLSSESQDQGVNRTVTVLKSHGFVSAPLKPLATSLRIRTLADEKEAAARASEREALRPDAARFNAIVLTHPSFALTSEDLEAALKRDLEHPSVVFAIDFRPTGDVILKASSRTFANALDPANIHETLRTLRPGVAATVARGNLAGAVHLAHVNADQEITRREKTQSSGEGGWSEVARRGAKGASPRSTPAGSDDEGKSGKVTLRLGMGRLTLGSSKARDRRKVDWFSKMPEEDVE